ncbi:MAG TPA: hypothetical protein P5522_11165 [Spirochaetia bacterium]|nr:hypothetical protein [Spirochaetia bacterium]
MPKRDLGLTLDINNPAERGKLITYINLKLSSMGLPIYSKEGTSFLNIANDMIANYREKNRLLGNYLPPCDLRIQEFLDAYFHDLSENERPTIPAQTVTLDRYGMARIMSLPPDAHVYSSPSLTSYRIRNGILHNPKNDRRTTEGVFHIAEGGLPVPLDKKAVPKIAFARMLKKAFNPPEDLMIIPFTATESQKAKAFVSLYLRPTVVPEVPGFIQEKALETRFFAPGSLVANLDFVESIFGNAGDPYIPTNDAALDPLTWTGHTSCIILAIHLTTCTKKELGLPEYSKATERQRRDGMCWESPDELYNDGKPFKICARDDRGVMVTIIADNYFGYSKKEIKTQISYSANLYGLAEEEHAGGALVFPSYNLGNRFVPDTNLKNKGQTLQTVMDLLGSRVEYNPEGYCIDRIYHEIIYIPENAVIELDEQKVSWTNDTGEHTIPLKPEWTYIHPTGYKIHLDQHPVSGTWRLIGTNPDCLLCHKPSTVSGGGKSEISKSIFDAITSGPFVIADFAADIKKAEEVINYNYGYRFKDEKENHGNESRPILSPKRSLGSVIKLLSPSPLYTDEFNAWLASIPDRVKALVFLVKRFYRPEWGNNWAEHFKADMINGTQGNVLKYKGRPIQASYLRVGFNEHGDRSLHKLRQDFMPAQKIQWEDDITASITVPVKKIPNLPDGTASLAIKIAKNCETRFFQRPDDAVIRGYDKQAESDMARRDNFISNFEPLTRSKANEILTRFIEYSEYTEPMRTMIKEAEADDSIQYFVCSSFPRMVDGKPSKNPRYLQLDRNYINPKDRYIADVGTRLNRLVKEDTPILYPVGAVLPGRRNNPPEPGIRPLAVYNPIHYQELPELFMDFVCSLTGKSPSTTGAGSEGALTKGPFNSLTPTSDLNNALLSYILCGYNGFTSAAGYIGHKYKIEHDISLLIPEIWSRLTPQERDPAFLIQNGYLEKVNDFEWNGKKIPASRLGYRITNLFAAHFLGRIFDSPGSVFPEDMLKPELQSMENFVDGILNITEAQAKSARNYIEDGSVEAAIPPLKAVLYIMAEGSYQGMQADHPEIRKLFTLEYVLTSSWYQERLFNWTAMEKQRLLTSKQHLQKWLDSHQEWPESERKEIAAKLKSIDQVLLEFGKTSFSESMIGTIGKDTLYYGK